MKFFDNNPRKITKKQFEQLSADLEEFGDLGGIVHDLNSDQVISGNQRCRALDLSRVRQVVTEWFDPPTRTGTVATGYIEWRGERFGYRAVKWTPEQCLAANIKANLDGGSWDFETLANWPADLLQGIGFDNDLLKDWQEQSIALGEMLAAEEGGDEGGDQDEVELTDKAEELQQKWQVRDGDIWQIDQHFVICGDCREPETWARLLATAKVDKVNGVFTSPPYAEQRKKQYGGVPTAEYVEWWESVQSNVRANLAGDGSFFVNIKPHCEDGQRVLYVFDLVLAMVRRWGWKFVDELCWVNGGYPGNFTPRFKNGFEPVYHFSIGDIIHNPDNVKFEMTDSNKRKTKWNQKAYGVGRHYSPTGSQTNRNDFTFSTETALPSNVLNIPADRGFLRDDTIINIHSATFPVALPTFFIKAYSDPGDVWVDPFAGSGTVGVAAQNEGRKALMIERLEKYVSVVLERMQQKFNIQPVRLFPAQP